jgi:cell division protein FtsN
MEVVARHDQSLPVLVARALDLVARKAKSSSSGTSRVGKSTKKVKISGGAIAGIVIAVVVLIIIALLVFWLMRRRKQKTLRSHRVAGAA